MYLHHGVLHELVHVVKVHASILVVEVGAKGEHDVVGGIGTGIFLDGSEEELHFMVHIVVIEIMIILQ